MERLIMTGIVLLMNALLAAWVLENLYPEIPYRRRFAFVLGCFAIAGGLDFANMVGTPTP